MISLAITTYDRSGFVIESFINVLNNPFINEIVIVDDCSDISIYNNLKTIIDNLNNPKIKLYRNETNLDVFLNKRRSVELCTNDWVIQFDSDNILGEDYINIIRGLGRLEEDMLYCPETLYDIYNTKVQWTYSEFNHLIFDKSNIRTYVRDVNFETNMNTGNNFFNRNTFLEATKESNIDEPIADISAGDGMYIYYLWILAGNRAKVVKGLRYIHRLHAGSNYLNHIEQGQAFNHKTVVKIENLK